MRQLDINLMHPAEQLALIIGRIYRTGMTTTSGGNLSILDDNGDLWITPASIDKGSLKPSDIMCVKPDGTVIGPHRPSSEYPFHRAIYRMNPQARSVIHAHPAGLVTFSILHRVPDTRILPLTAQVCGPVGYADYAVPGSELLGQKIVGAFQENPDCKAVIMENHGVVVFGSDIADAYGRFESLEFCARTLLNARALGTPRLLTDEQLRLHRAALEIPERALASVEHPSAERSLRTELCGLVHRACTQGLMGTSYGSASVRLQGDDFLVTPEDLPRWNLEPEDIVQVCGGRAEPGKQASAALALHAEIYRRNPKVNSVILTLTPALMAFCTTGAEFDVRTIPESWIFLQDVPVFPLVDKRRDLETIAEALLKRPFVMVESDTVVVTGDKLINTFDRLEVAEFCARSLILAAPSGKLKPITDTQIDELRIAFHIGEP